MNERQVLKPFIQLMRERKHTRTRVCSNSQGFTLLEIAIVMVIIGLLMGGGVSVMKMLTERKSRLETLDYLQKTRQTLLNFASINGRFPWADNDNNGSENNGVTAGTLPYLTLQISPVDAYKRVLRYEVNSLLSTSKANTCATLRTGLSQRPFMVDADGSAASFSVAVVLVSAGVMDADNSGSPFDGITTGSHQGNNTTGNPNYLRAPPLSTFDDMVTYVSGNEIYSELCEYVNIAVNNTSTSTIYVYQANQALDLGTLLAAQSGLYSVLSGARIEIRTAAMGAGTIVPGTTPKTPAIFSGHGATINIP
jgi:prepilin-type N-terminal cleavage/methylation domain-containing protein